MDPLLGPVPVQPPEARQELTLVAAHVSVELPPTRTLVGLAVSVTVGAAAAATVTLADWEAVPPAPLQVSV
jgi:hypothetical protein